jgi:hypothetical protein
MVRCLQGWTTFAVDRATRRCAVSNPVRDAIDSSHRAA